MMTVPMDDSRQHDRQLADLREQVAALQLQVQQAQKLTALGELVSTTTHEFNNVLMTILNYAKMGIRHKDEPTRDKALEKILQAGERAARLTNSVLGLARNRAPTFEPTDLRVVIEETLFLLEREMQQYKISVETQIAAVPQVPAIGNQIQQVLLNLLINARQAMSPGGRILIKLDLDTKNGTVDLLVRDSGSGIPPEKLRRIFEPFYTTKNGPDESGRGGTGLGLAACRSIIEAHRGKLRVESSVGKGTAFTLRLPVVRQDEAAADKTSAPPAMPAALPSSPGAAPSINAP